MTVIAVPVTYSARIDRPQSMAPMRSSQLAIAHTLATRATAMITATTSSFLIPRVTVHLAFAQLPSISGPFLPEPIEIITAVPLGKSVKLIGKRFTGTA